MNKDKKIHIKGKRSQYLAPGQSPIVRIKPDVYNMLVDVANDSTSAIGAVASSIIRQAIENDLIVYDKEGES